MNRLLLTGFLLMILAAARAGDFRLIKTLPMPVNEFSVDILGQIYWAEGSTLYRYNPATDEKIEYSNAFLGDIHSWDASNPLKILVFHKDYNTLVFIDKNLSQIRSPIPLDQLGINQAGACCTSRDGGFWVINQTTRQLQQYDASLQLRQESPMLAELNTRSDTKPLIREQNGNLYAALPNCCALIFDRFGNLVRRNPLKNVNNIQILNQNIYYFYEGDLFKLNQDLHHTESIPLPRVDEEWINAKMGTRNMLYLLKDQELYIYES